MSHSSSDGSAPPIYGNSALPLGHRILLYVNAHPDSDDVEIAAGLGENPFRVSEAIRIMELAGLVSSRENRS